MNLTLNISEAGAIALHAAVFMAARPRRLCSAAEMAGALGVSRAHLEKVLQRLTHAGLSAATRGPGGGHRMIGNPQRISLLKVFEAIEGRLSPTACLLGRKACGAGKCFLGDTVTAINRRLATCLKGTTIADAAAFNRSDANQHLRRRSRRVSQPATRNLSTKATRNQ